MLNDSSRKDERALKGVSVKNKAGYLVALSNFISFETRPSELEILHRDGLRSVTLTASLIKAGTTALDAAEIIKERLKAAEDIPSGVDIEVAGEASKTMLILSDIKIAVLAAVAAIFLLLALFLNSWKNAAIIMAIVPFSVIGIILALFIHSQPISMFVLLALIGLSGVVVNDSIVMTDALSSPGAADSFESIGETASRRLRPILLTTLTTLSGLLPMAYGLGGYEKMISPMSLAFAWGLFFSTVITLYIVPVLFSFQRAKSDN
jgi:multidrug efflux pump subunit AcrB